jgi:hypothetical protein
MKLNAETLIALTEAQDLAMQIVDFVQEKDPGRETKWRLALAIAYATMSKATDQPLHQVMETVMTIYKNTEVHHDDEM